MRSSSNLVTKINNFIILVDYIIQNLMKDYQSIYQGTPPYLTVQFSKSPREQQYKDMFTLTFFPYFTYSSFTFIWIILNILVFGSCLWLEKDTSSQHGQLYQLTQKSLFPLGESYPYYVLKEKQYFRILTSLVLFRNFTHMLISVILILSVGSYVQHIIQWKKTFLLTILSGLCGTLSVCIFRSEPTVDGFTPIFGMVGYLIGYSMLRWKYWIRYSNQRVHMFLGIVGIMLIGFYFAMNYQMVSLVSLGGAIVFGFVFSLQDDTQRKGWTAIRVIALILMVAVLGVLIGLFYFRAQPHRI